MTAFVDKGYGFLSFDYRGFGKSEGQPTESGLYRDMEAATQFLIQKGIPVERQIAMGGSIGSGVAIDAATRHPYRVVITCPAYTSTPEAGAYIRDRNGLGWLGFIPLNFIMQQRFESIKKIANIHSPLILMHGEEDEMMPVEMSKALYDMAGTNHKRVLVIPHATHNNVFSMGQSVLLNDLEDLLKETETKHGVI